MRSTLAALGLTAMLAQGCIIYEEHYVHDTGCPSCEGGTWDDSPRGDDDDVDEPDPMPVLDLFFTDAQGAQGETKLTTLRSNDPQFDLSAIDTVRFAAGIEVLDSMLRTDEVVLLIAIDMDASVGPVDAFVTSAGGVGIVGTPFVITESSAGDDDDDDTTGLPGDDDDDTTGTTGDDDDDTTSTPVDTGTPGDDDDDVPSCGVDPDTSDTGCP